MDEKELNTAPEDLHADPDAGPGNDMPQEAKEASHE